MKHNFSKQEIIEFGKRLAKSGMICEYKPRSHSRNCFSLFPQTEAQYNWLKRKYGTTFNLCILYTIEEVLLICPELSDFLKETKSKRFTRIDLTL